MEATGGNVQAACYEAGTYSGNRHLRRTVANRQSQSGAALMAPFVSEGMPSLKEIDGIGRSLERFQSFKPKDLDILQKG